MTREVGRSRALVHESIGVLGTRVRPHLRRWLAFSIVALVSLVAGHVLHRQSGSESCRIGSYICVGLVIIFGVIVTRSIANGIGDVVAEHAGRVAAEPVRIGIQLVGYLLSFLAVLAVLQVNVNQFLVGGALTGVVLGIAAQQALGSFFAGVVLMLARPYSIGEKVTVFSGAINGPHDGEIAGVSLLYTTVWTADGPLHVPNSVMLGSAVRSTEQPTEAP